MQIKILSNHIFIALFTIVMVTLLHKSLVDDIFAISPSFSRQEIKDNSGDGIKVNGVNLTYITDTYNDPLDKATDIQSVDYYSDGKTLNATIWLKGNTPNNNKLVNVSNLIYGMLIDADSNQATGKDGVDYQIELQWNNKYKTWIKFFTEYSSEGYRRELNKQILTTLISLKKKEVTMSYYLRI